MGLSLRVVKFSYTVINKCSSKNMVELKNKLEKLSTMEKSYQIKLGILQEQSLLIFGYEQTAQSLGTPTIKLDGTGIEESDVDFEGRLVSEYVDISTMHDAVIKCKSAI